MADHRLDADPEYWELTESEHKRICNGCGAKRGINVPDTIYGLRVTEACNIHDFDYHKGRTKADKDRADARLLYNLLQLIEAQTGWHQVVLKPLRRRRALKYYEAVVTFGDSAFWAGKDRSVHVDRHRDNQILQESP